MTDLRIYNSNSKINFYLDVISLLKNGYHEIRSVFCEISLSDIIEVKKNDLGILRFFDKKNILPENNLLKRAGDLFCNYIKNIPFGLDISVEKNIPIGGGLGGGSSNAASVLKILNEIWKIKFSNGKLKRIGSNLGADVPFFIEGKVQKVTGIGNRLKAIKNSKFDINILLVIPKVSILTKNAYSLIDKYHLFNKSNFYNNQFENIIIGFRSHNFKMIIDNIYNVFEEVIFNEYPEIKKVYFDILNTNSLKVFMTGSGSTLVGIYENKNILNDAVEILRNKGHAVICANIV